MKTTTLLVIVSAIHTLGAEVTLRPSSEQPRWIEPRNHSGFVADFEYIVPETPVIAELQVFARVEFNASVSDLGACALWNRAGGSQEILPLFTSHPLTVSTNASEGSLMAVIGPKQEGKSSLVPGVNFITFVVDRVPSLPTGGKIHTTLTITGEFPDGLAKVTSSTEIRVRGLFPLIRIHREKTAFSDLTVIVEGGLPNQSYDILESSDFATWRVKHSFRNIVGDGSFGMRQKEARMFFYAIPSAAP